MYEVILKRFDAIGVGRLDDDERRRRFAAVRRDGRGTFRGTGMRPDGSTFHEETQIALVEIDGDERYLVLVRDLTDSMYDPRKRPFVSQQPEGDGFKSYPRFEPINRIHCHS